MEQLLQKDGAMNVNWEGSSTNIARDKLSTIATVENGQFKTDLIVSL